MYNPATYFTEEEQRQIHRLGVSIRNNIIPLQYKDHFFISTGQIWDIDTYTAECCQCLALDEKRYDQRMELFAILNPENVVNPVLMKRVCYEYKIRSLEKLKALKDSADEIIVCEAGRGIDVLIAHLVKPWKKIVAYDQDKSVLHEMQKYFKGELGLPFEAIQIASVNFNFAQIQEKTFIFGTCHNVDANKQEEIKMNPNLIGLFDGEIIQRGIA